MADADAFAGLISFELTIPQYGSGKLDSSLEDLVCPISIQSKIINLGVVEGDYD